ncbi:MAG: dienelactone hydrolase family protein [Saprospiraceae bacterium]
MHRHIKQVVSQGLPLAQAQKALIMIHGRGASAEAILQLSQQLKVDGFTLLVPQAKDNTWYPHSFMAPVAQNEPGLSTGLGVIYELVAEVKESGIATNAIFFLGFSQGACLCSEFVARNGTQYGGVFLFSGGLIGAEIDRGPYQGDFKNTPIFLGCSDVDSHVPLHRVQESTAVFCEMGAQVTERIYPNAPHSVFANEIAFANAILSQ